MKTEWTCERCGIRVLSAIPQPDETLYCPGCRFVESIDDPVAKAEAARVIDAQHAQITETLEDRGDA